MAYVSFKTKRALGAKYSRPPEVELEEKRLEQRYAMMPEMARIAEAKRQANIAMLDKKQSRGDAKLSAMVGTAGNIAKLGMQAYQSSQKPQPATQMMPENRPTDVSMYDKQFVTPSVSDVNTLATSKPSTGSNALNTASSAIGTAGSALNAYNELQRGDYVRGALDTAQTGIGMYNTGKSLIEGINTASSASNTAAAATNTASAAANTASGASSLTSALPIVGAAINIGKGAYDTATAKNGQKAVQGVWKMVDGVLQYAVPFYGMGRGISSLIKTAESALGLQDGSDAAKAVNTVQDIFGDPAGMMAGESGPTYLKDMLKLDDTWICTATNKHAGMGTDEISKMKELREYAAEHHNGWLASYLENGPMLIDAIAEKEANLEQFYGSIRLILVEPVCSADTIEKSFKIYLAITKMLFRAYLPNFDFVEV